MLTAHGDKYYIYLHLSSNSGGKWPLRAQVMSAVARGYSRSHTTFQFLTSFVWTKLQRRGWKFPALLSHTLCAANPRSADSGEFKQVATYFFSMNTMIHRSQNCSGDHTALRRRVPNFKGRTSGKWQDRGHEGKGSNSAAPSEIGTRSLGVGAVQANTLSKGHQPLQNELLLCPFPSSSRYF